MTCRVALRLALLPALLLLLPSCTVLDPSARALAVPGKNPPQLTPATSTHEDLVALPEPAGKITASVYAFRDLSGQYKQAPDSAYSTAVTQGAAAMLTKAMLDSGWFLPVEREGLQDLMTERRILRGGKEQDGTSAIPDLVGANILLEGGIVAYETNVRTGGLGIKYWGAGAHDEYRTDQVTVNLRAVDVRTGVVLDSVNTTRTIYSKKIGADFYRFVRFKKLLEAEAGYTRNEPAQLCVQEAIEAALVHLIVDGLEHRRWTTKDPQAINSPLVQSYLHPPAARDLPPATVPVTELSPPAAPPESAPVAP